MKKIFNRLTSLIFVLMFMISASGCSMILDIEQEYNTNYTTQVTVDIELNKQLIFCDTYNDTASPNIEKVTFNTNGKTEDYAQIEDAAASVNRSIVKIIMQDEKGQDLGYGSGVIVDIDGGRSLGEYYVLTCHHVVSGAGKISVCVPDANLRNHGDLDYDERYIFSGYIGGVKTNNPFQVQEVSLVGGDRDADVAVLKLSTLGRIPLPPINIQEATFPQSEDYLNGSLNYAQEVFAIGNPTGQLPMTFLSGNISYLDRLVAIDSIGYMTLIQHDCLITHGNSGGGLFNMKGQLIGITNAGSDVYKGMNYAIPFYGENGFMAIAERLIKSNTQTNYGYIEGRWSLGVTITEDEDKVDGSSVIILSVEEHSNSYEKLKKGDYIVKVFVEVIFSLYPSYSTFTI